MRVAIVVQRFGVDVVGGAEQIARDLAERLALRHDVTVLTTCARSYRDWANEYAEGEALHQGVKVCRFQTVRKRQWGWFGRTSRLLFLWRSLVGWALPFPSGRRWVIRQGPYSPELVQYIRQEGRNFEVFLFFTYLYYPTVFGLPWVAEKAVLVPTAHEEPPIFLPLFRTLFQLPRYLVFLTEEERAFVHRQFRNQEIPYQVIGSGVDLQTVSEVDDGYLLYVGRVDAAKNCAELFSFCRRLRIPLKVAGPRVMEIPGGIDYCGVVDEAGKRELFARCRALVMPSPHESLSLSVLEAWAHGKPVIVSQASPVLTGQVHRSGGGYIYGDFSSFREIVRHIDPRRGLAGRRYIEDHYAWGTVLSKYEAVLRSVG